MEPEAPVVPPVAGASLCDPSREVEAGSINAHSKAKSQVRWVGSIACVTIGLGSAAFGSVRLRCCTLGSQGLLTRGGRSPEGAPCPEGDLSI
jgi:hypothetical protein